MAKDKASKVVYIDELVSDEEAAREVRSTYREVEPAKIRSGNGDEHSEKPNRLLPFIFAFVVFVFLIYCLFGGNL